MKYNIEITPYQLIFKFKAGTSRGWLENRNSFFIKVYASNNLQKFGLGEASPLKGLSIDYIDNFELKLEKICQTIGQINISKDNYLNVLNENISKDFPSIKFALETAFLDLFNGGQQIIFNSNFAKSQKKININGLIWMGNKAFMQKQVEDKIKAGFKCIKMKIGAINFETEYKILRTIRQRFSVNELILRVDANGAFSSDEVMEKLEKLTQLDIHSIEQPIKPHQIKEMKKLCEESPLPIALDEELIGKHTLQEKKDLLNFIKPQFIILKPTLLGGFEATKEWIKTAENLNIDWWITSALESNVGLNAICQFTAEFDNKLHQGLGTGGLYTNNIASPLELDSEQIFINLNKSWDLSIFK